jgi:hypothetical protein
MNRWRAVFTVQHWRLWFGLVAFGYGVFAVYRVASKQVVSGSSEAITHVMLWTFLPPLWFAFESFVLCKTPQERETIRPNQELASKIWAAVLAAILFLLNPGGPQQAVSTRVQEPNGTVETKLP